MRKTQQQGAKTKKNVGENTARDETPKIPQLKHKKLEKTPQETAKPMKNGRKTRQQRAESLKQI